MTEKSRKSGKPKKPRTRKQKIISHVTTALLVAVLLVGVGVMAYPTFSDWWNNLHQSKAIATYEEVVADTSQEELDEMWAAAEAFNEKVAAAGFSLQYSDEMEKEYESLLDVSGTGIMGYVEIDSVGIKLPIYHGTSEGVLQIAVGHLEGTSLPVGGANTHCVLSGHTGLPSAKLFTDIDTSYVSIGRIVRSGGIQACLDFYESIGKEAAEELKSMLVFDAVIYNEDRHFGNFGILRDNHTGKILGPAPIFDNGLSLFNYAMPDDIQTLEEYAKTRANPYGITYEAICREVMGTKQRNQLRRLIGFRFTRHPSINLPEERLTAIEKHIDRRVRELLALPRAKKE